VAKDTPALRLVLGDQLSFDVASLRDTGPGDVVLMAEVRAEATYVRHHKKKIAFIFAAMRKFAAALAGRGVTVRYVRIDDPANTHSIEGEVLRACADLSITRVIATQCGEWRLDQIMQGWHAALGLEVEIREDARFLASRADFARWAEGRKSYRMEFFYRDMRRRYGVLMDGTDPVGGQWNYDAENREKLPKGLSPPKRARFSPDEVTQGAIDDVARLFPDHFGDLGDFWFATDHEGATAALDHFLSDILELFGDYQDAMAVGEPLLWHSLISMYLNIGLLDAKDIITRTEEAYRKGAAPLNAAEGFIRQILGWREYVRGIYWLKMPGYARTNALGASRPLPAFYWTGDTDMKCLAEAVGDTRRNAYAHHIQRLMVTGNFALLAGIDPAEVNEWYMIVYADAFEWVELPNTHGMALFADNGVMASKPYAASGKYIQRMSNYCAACRFDPGETLGEKACPFNALYWDFMARNEKHLAGNPRLAMPYKNLRRFDPERVAAMRATATDFLDQIAPMKPEIA
jgi:deoxyribodipyrimidine photolyase-related protein